MENVIEKGAAESFNRDSIDLFQRRSDSYLLSHSQNLPRFNNILKTSSSQTGNNEMALSDFSVENGVEMKKVCSNFRRKLLLGRVSDSYICERLRLVYDDRSTSQSRGYKFVYIDGAKFARQAILKSSGPLLNYFEEIKKARRHARFYNVPPITTDIAIAEISNSKLPTETSDISITGLKRVSRDSVEAKYLRQFESEIADYRAIFFLRSILSHLRGFKNVVADLNIDSALVWLPAITDESIDNLRDLVLLSFCFSITDTEFKQIEISHEGFSWSTVDFFDPTGWLKDSRIIAGVYDRLLDSVSEEVKKECMRSFNARKRKAKYSAENILGLAEKRF
jgi:hypothetical protein